MHIAFIAMSGIRACDTELLRLGLTLPGFVERSKAIASLPSLGLLTLAGLTPPEHTVSYHEIPDLAPGPGLPPELPGHPDLVAISSFSAQIGEAYALADRCRAAGVRVVLGGLHVTALPTEAAAHADAVVIGEGEPVWPQLVADAARGALQPVYDARGTPFDFAHAPLPAYHLLDLKRYNRITVQTSRGCPRRCAFCASSILLTRDYRQKPIPLVLRDIDAIRDRWPQPFLEFADDNSVVHRRYWRELLPHLATRHLRWFTETDLGVALDADLLDQLRDAGCLELLIGLESPVVEGLGGLELNSDWKRHQFQRYRQAIRAIQSHGIRVNGCFIVGLDGHGPGIFDAIYDFVAATELFDVQVTLPTPFPGTPFYDQLKAAGRLTHDGQWHRCTLFDVNFQPARMSVSELEHGFRDLVVRLYSAEFTAWRKERFRQNLRRYYRQRRLPAAG
jgi:radical SAM superfamily enzyme YgiQ (UPF0313 family)